MKNYYTLPSWTIQPLVYLDYLAITADEEQELELFLDSLPKNHILLYVDDAGFCWSNDLNDLGGDCAIFELVDIYS